MIDTLIAGLLRGNVYALGAVGISLVFGVMNVVNFAQFSFFGLGAMLSWFFVVKLGLAAFPCRTAGDDAGENVATDQFRHRRGINQLINAQLNHVRAGLGGRGDVALGRVEVLDEDGDAELGHR